MRYPLEPVDALLVPKWRFPFPGPPFQEPYPSKQPGTWSAHVPRYCEWTTLSMPFSFTAPKALSRHSSWFITCSDPTGHFLPSTSIWKYSNKHRYILVLLKMHQMFLYGFQTHIVPRVYTWASGLFINQGVILPWCSVTSTIPVSPIGGTFLICVLHITVSARPRRIREIECNASIQTKASIGTWFSFLNTTILSPTSDMVGLNVVPTTVPIVGKIPRGSCDDWWFR